MVPTPTRRSEFKPIKRWHLSLQLPARRASEISGLTSKVDKARAVFAAAPSARIMTIPHRPGNSPTAAMASSGTRKGQQVASPGAEIHLSRSPAAKRLRVGRVPRPTPLSRHSSPALQPTCRRRPGGCSACVCSCSCRFFTAG